MIFTRTSLAPTSPASPAAYSVRVPVGFLISPPGADLCGGSNLNGCLRISDDHRLRSSSGNTVRYLTHRENQVNRAARANVARSDMGIGYETIPALSLPALTPRVSGNDCGEGLESGGGEKLPSSGASVNSLAASLTFPTCSDALESNTRPALHFSHTRSDSKSGGTYDTQRVTPATTGTDSRAI